MLVKLALSEEARRSAADAVLGFAKQDPLALPALLDFTSFDDCEKMIETEPIALVRRRAEIGLRSLPGRPAVAPQTAT
jgi:hypothetical protein